MINAYYKYQTEKNDFNIYKHLVDSKNDFTYSFVFLRSKLITNR